MDEHIMAGFNAEFEKNAIIKKLVKKFKGWRAANKMTALEKKFAKRTKQLAKSKNVSSAPHIAVKPTPPARPPVLPAKQQIAAAKSEAIRRVAASGRDVANAKKGETMYRELYRKTLDKSKTLGKAKKNWRRIAGGTALVGMPLAYAAGRTRSSAPRSSYDTAVYRPRRAEMGY